ncbi:Emerin [Labeo rohita]|uniref:Emerin n=1 Tax=Labeo rohita TaxID=84645 RepID=A0ABQ8LGJ8_LABRO|nr:Emerin [Labeo rohita]
MSSLSGKSDKEIGQLLDEYGIKHGPIVDSTRKLYEKKLHEAMAKKPKSSSPDKTFYREEQEEVEYITYHQAQPQMTRFDGFGDVPTRTSYQSSSRLGSSVPKSMQHGSSSPESSKSGGVPGWLRVLVFIIIAVFLYYVYTCMEPAEETPFKTIQ